MTVTAEQILALRGRVPSLTREEAADELQITRREMKATLEKLQIKWPRPCYQRHPLDDKVVVKGFQRCRLCQEAERESRRAVLRNPTAQRERGEVVNTTRQAMLDALEASNALDRAIARETAPPWERHPVQPDPRDYRPARAQ